MKRFPAYKRWYKENKKKRVTESWPLSTKIPYCCKQGWGRKRKTRLHVFERTRPRDVSFFNGNSLDNLALIREKTRSQLIRTKFRSNSVSFSTSFSIQIFDLRSSISLNRWTRNIGGMFKNVRMFENAHNDYVENATTTTTWEQEAIIVSKSWACFRKIDSRLISIKFNRPGLTWHTKSSFTLVIIMFLSHSPLFKYKTTTE